MSAQVIQFPRAKKSQVAPVESDELIVYPSHWSDHQQHMFDHMVNDGRNVAEATAHIEAQIRDHHDAKDLPEREMLLFLARRAMHRMKPIKH